MQRAHKIRLNPMPSQEIWLRKATGTARFAYNYGLRAYKAALDAKTKPEGALALKKAFNAIKGEQFPWVYEVTKCAVDTGFRNLSAALNNFWKSKKGERKGKQMGFPPAALQSGMVRWRGGGGGSLLPIDADPSRLRVSESGSDAGGSRVEL